MTEDDWGCLLGLVAVAAGGWWLYNHYEIRKKSEVVEFKALPTETALPRPTGLYYVTEVPDKTVWYLVADSVRGDRRHRQGWIHQDHSKRKAPGPAKTMVMYNVDCGTTAYHTMAFLTYDKAGKVIDQWPDSAFTKANSYPPPQSYIGDAIDAMCLRSFDQPLK